MSADSQSVFDEQMKSLLQLQQDMSKQVTSLRMDVNRMRTAQEDASSRSVKDWFILLTILALHTVVLNWVFSWIGCTPK